MDIDGEKAIVIRDQDHLKINVASISRAKY